MSRSHRVIEPASDAVREEQLRHLVACATMAPSSHNAQPWHFRIGEDHVDVVMDASRALPVADPEGRERYASVGCALENLRIAAAHLALATDCEYFPDGDRAPLVARVRVTGWDLDGPERVLDLYPAIPRRHTCRHPFDHKPVEPEALARLAALADDADVDVLLLDDVAVRLRFDELTVRADALQFADPAWRHELARWMGEGAFGHGWLGARMARLAIHYLDLGRTTARRDHAMVITAPILGVIVTRDDTRLQRVKAGQLLERVWLRAEAMDLRVHPMNQVLQLRPLREELSAHLPGPLRAPQLTFRLGHGPADHATTPRRSLEEVLA